MPQLARFHVNLSGWTGAPGISILHFRTDSEPFEEESLTTVAGLIASAYQDVASWLVGGLKVDIGPDVELIDDASGTLMALESITPPAQVSGVGSMTTLSRATMLIARLRTDSVVNGRLLQGRIFLGPASGAAFDSNGQVAGTARTSVADAFDGLLDIFGARLAVWHRPSSAGATDGSSGFVQTVSCSPTPGVLRSRRD